MKTNGGFLVTKIKQLGDRIFEKILSEKNIDAFNGAQGRILYVLWQEDGISIRSLSIKCGLWPAGKIGAGSWKRASCAGSELSKKRRCLLYRDRPLAEIYGRVCDRGTAGPAARLCR